MKHRTSLIALIFASIFLGLSCEASSVIGIPMPFDDRAAKLAIWTNSITANQIEADRLQYDAIEGQLKKLPENRLKALFGAPQDDVPKEYTLPVHHRDVISLPGYYPGKMRSYFYQSRILVAFWCLHMEMVILLHPSRFISRRIQDSLRCEAVQIIPHGTLGIFNTRK